VIARRAILAALLLMPTLALARGENHPLLDYARKREATRSHDPHNIASNADVAEAQHALDQGHVPAELECASSLGAQRYASLYASLAAARAGVGDLPGAAAAYRSAHACRPRDADLLGALGEVLFDARDYAAARATVDAALAIDPRGVSANRLAGNIAFVDERWPDAITRFRYVAASDPDRHQAAYGQLMLWLAQARAGMPHPEYVLRAPGEGWPQPLLLYLTHEYTESELVTRVKEGDDESNTQPNTSTDERLCEALYYVGEAYWARGRPDVARDYFTALVNIKVLYFLEHGIALAEIAKLRP
jgi:lipoprotein NlpI